MLAKCYVQDCPAVCYRLTFEVGDFKGQQTPLHLAAMNGLVSWRLDSVTFTSEKVSLILKINVKYVKFEII